MSNRQTAKEAALQVLFEDMDTLLERADKLPSAVDEAAERAASSIQKAGKAASDDIQMARSRVAEQDRKDREELRAALKESIERAEAATRAMKKSGGRLALYVFMLGSIAGMAMGVIGGTLAFYFLG